MHTSLVPYGDKKALIIDDALLQQLDIDLETPLDLTASGGTLIVTPVRDEDVDPEFRAMMEKIKSRYSHTFKRLAE